jgi:hypothetical protein
MRKLKAMILAQCKSSLPMWTPDLEKLHNTCVDSLRVATQKINEYNGKYSKKKPQLDVKEEESKLEKEIADLSGGKFVIGNRRISATAPPADKSISYPTFIQAIAVSSVKPVQPQLKPPVINLETGKDDSPVRGVVYDPMPE